MHRAKLDRARDRMLLDMALALQKLLPAHLYTELRISRETFKELVETTAERERAAMRAARRPNRRRSS